MTDDKFFGLSANLIRIAAILYTLLLVYGTLFPFHGWEIPQSWAESFLVADTDRLAKTDLIMNILIYLPFGFLWGGLFCAKWRWLAILVVVGLFGFGVSFCLELAQSFLPGRMSALSDLVLNGMGAMAGGSLTLFLSGRWAWGSKLWTLRREKFVPGSMTNIGLLAVAFWALSQLSPLVPSLGVSNLRHGLKPLWYTLTAQTPLVPLQALVYFFSSVALGAIMLSVGRLRHFSLAFFGAGVLAVLALKIPVLSRQLSMEALLGCGTGLLLLVLTSRASTRTLVAGAGFFLIAAFLAESLRPGSSSAFYAFNWVPFKGHMRNLVGLAGIFWSSWIFLGIGFVVRFLSSSTNQRLLFFCGGAGVLFLSLGVELQQRAIPGRSPDITDVCIALAAWLFAWVGVDRREREARMYEQHR